MGRELFSEVSLLPAKPPCLLDLGALPRQLHRTQPPRYAPNAGACRVGSAQGAGVT